MKASELFAALEEGKLLEKDYAKAYPELGYRVEGENVEYAYLDSHWAKNYIIGKGWASAGQEIDKIQDMFKNPHYWQISKYSIDDKPWIK